MKTNVNKGTDRNALKVAIYACIRSSIIDGFELILKGKGSYL